MWNLEGMKVEGSYLSTFPVTGTVRLSRIEYGGGVCHHITLDNPIMVYGRIRESVMLEHYEVLKVSDN